MIEIAAIAVSAAAVWISYLQWTTATARGRVVRLEYKLKLYDRRVRIRDAAYKLLSTALIDLRPSREDLVEFRMTTTEASSFFGPEIVEYLEEIYNRGLELRTLSQKQELIEKGRRIDASIGTVLAKQEEVQTWFAKQLDEDVVHEAFKDYLQVSDL